MVSSLLASLKPSATLVAAARAKALKDAGKDVLSFTIGEPDFIMPQIVRRKTAEYLLSDKVDSHYSEVAGKLALRKALADKFLKENKIAYGADDIVVTPGAKFALYEAILSIVDPSDEVLIPVPTWVSYIDIVRDLAKGIPIMVDTSPNHFKLTAHMLENKITSKTKALLFCSPSNPTGAMIDPHELQKIADLCVKNSIWMISDEIYEKITYGKVSHVSIASLGEKVKERTITINGFSKAYAMTGERIGYLAGPTSIIAAIKSFQGQTTNHIASTIQYEALCALQYCQDDVHKMQKAFSERKDFVYRRLNSIPGIQCLPIDGAFYAFFDHSRIDKDDLRFSERLLDEQHVALVAGTHFEGKGHCRFSFASDMETLKQGLDRIEAFVKRYRI